MNEERRCGYLRKEMALWKAYQVKMIEYRAENGNSYQEKQYRKTMVRSQLGEQLKMCYDVLHGRREGIKGIGQFLSFFFYDFFFFKFAG